MPRGKIVGLEKKVFGLRPIDQERLEMIQGHLGEEASHNDVLRWLLDIGAGIVTEEYCLASLDGDTLVQVIGPHLQKLLRK